MKWVLAAVIVALIALAVTYCSARSDLYEWLKQHDDEA